MDKLDKPHGWWREVFAGQALAISVWASYSVCTPLASDCFQDLRFRSDQSY